MDRLPLVFTCVVALASPAFAQGDPPVEGEPAREPVPPLPEPIDDTKQRIDTLEQRMQDLEEKLEEAKDDNKDLEEKIATLMPLAGKLGGYVDVGMFATTGNGAGTRSDLIGFYFPDYIGVIPGSWVFMGDPLSTMVNSRGDVADTGESRAITFDPINSRGNSTFLVNAVNLTLFTGVGETGSAMVSVDFVPRARDIGDVAGLFLGDYIDVKLAYGEWKPTLEKLDLSLQAGKFDSVVGREYRVIEAPDRTGITPSLLCRYLCGQPIGVKARAVFAGSLIANVAVTNGSHFTESFSFHDETDANEFKTVAGRVSYGDKDGAWEVGASGSIGAQDVQGDNATYQWHVGADAHLDIRDFEVTAEYIQGDASGATSEMGTMSGAVCDLAPCLEYKAAYGQAAYRATNTFTPYLRVDWRDALHRSGASFVYVSEVIRGTVGLRAEIGARLIWKLELVKNYELGALPQFPNDVVTTSLVIKL
jgi:hypothetical protein